MTIADRLSWFEILYFYDEVLLLRFYLICIIRSIDISLSAFSSKLLHLKICLEKHVQNNIIYIRYRDRKETTFPSEYSFEYIRKWKKQDICTPLLESIYVKEKNLLLQNFCRNIFSYFYISVPNKKKQTNKKRIMWWRFSFLLCKIISKKTGRTNTSFYLLYAYVRDRRWRWITPQKASWIVETSCIPSGRSAAGPKARFVCARGAHWPFGLQPSSAWCIPEGID